MTFNEDPGGHPHHQKQNYRQSGQMFAVRSRCGQGSPVKKGTQQTHLETLLACNHDIVADDASAGGTSRKISSFGGWKPVL